MFGHLKTEININFVYLATLGRHVKFKTGYINISSELGFEHSVHWHLLLYRTLSFVEDGELCLVELSEQCILLNLTWFPLWSGS